LCRFFDSADGEPWIRGRTVGDEFRPYKKFRLANSKVKKVYKLSHELDLPRAGVDFIDGVLAQYGKKGSMKITSLRVHPCMKIVRNPHDGFDIKRKSARSSGYKIAMALIEGYKMVNIQGTDAQNAEEVRKFIVALAEDPKKAISEMGKKMGSCCICGLNLTDPYSIENGYGKICATRIFVV
jgi:hypothetical protein